MPKEEFHLILEKAIDDVLDDSFKKFMHEEFYKLMFPYIPYDTGQLASTTDIGLFDFEIGSIPDEVSMSLGLLSGNINEDGITFTADYAEDCYYYVKNWHKDKHPLATEEWGIIAFENHKEELTNILNEEILWREYYV